MPRKVLLVLVVPIAVFLAMKLYLHHRVAKTVDMMLQPAQMVAKVEYESITSSIGGKIGVTGIVVTPYSVDDQIRVDEVAVKFPSFWYLWNLEERLESKQPPESFRVSVSGIEIATRGAIAKQLESAAFANASSAELAAYENCVTRVTKLPTQWSLLGYDKLVSSVHFGYAFDPTEGELVLDVSIEQQGAAQMGGEIAVPLESFDVMSVTAALSDPTLLWGKMHLRDLGYVEKIFDYCDGTGTERDETTELLVAELTDVFGVLPLTPNEQMLEAYAGYVAGADELTLTMNPYEPKKLSYLTLYAPEDVPALLNIRAQIN